MSRLPFPRSHKTVLILAWVILLSLSGCSSFSPSSTQQPNPGAVNTAIAQTVAAQVTQVSGQVSAQETISAGQTAVAMLTAIVKQATNTPIAPPASPTPTPTSEPPTATSLPATATPVPLPTYTPIPCNLAQFVRDVTVEDGSVFSPGTIFTKIWRIRNIGSCTWDANYSIIFVNGTAMTTRSVQGLGAIVRSGETIDIAVDLTAPTSQGQFRGNWMLRNPNGAVFGVGVSGDVPFYVDIRVIARANPDYEYDLAAYFCDAEWRTAEGTIPCGGFTNDNRGSVSYITDPSLETRQENEPALWVRPNRSRDGFISGTYPAYTVKANDHFVSELSCVSGETTCKASFQLDYIRSNGAVRNLGVWNEVLDGNTTIIDIDLTAIAGEKVRFVLTVRNQSKSSELNAIWFVPSVRQVVVTSSQVMEWRQQGGTSDVCYSLSLYLYGTRGGEAYAYDCKSGPQKLLGSETLNLSEFNQLSQWVSVLAPFDSRVIPASSPDQPTTWITLRGRGSVLVSASELQAMDNYAQFIFNTIIGSTIH